MFLNAEVHKILTVSPHCLNTFSKDYEELAEVDKIHYSELLASLIASEVIKPLYSIDIKVTYHDPCHARKVQGIWQEPRNLLAQNYPMKEMSDPNRCCGFGGVTMQTEKFHLAEAAGKPKAAMIKDTKAKYVSAECSACRVQLSEAMNNAEVETIFKNPLELIAEALKD